MKYYLGLNQDNHADLLTCREHKTVLFSYHYLGEVKRATSLMNKYSNNHFIIDSGAFSSWSIGKEINIKELLKFYQSIQAFRPDTVFINLDKIPGSRGKKPNKTEAENACKISLENYNYLKKHIKNLLPVFHEDDDFSYLEIMKQETDYIAISPANDSSTKKRIQWLDKVYSNLKADYKTHSLAGTSDKLLKRYPFYSCDSVNYRAFWMYGRGEHYSRAELTALRKNSINSKAYLDKVLSNEIKAYKRIEADITNLWKRRGVKWEN